MSLEGRVYAIAGIGGGLGPAVAERLAGAGAVVAGADRDEGRAAAVLESLGIPEERRDARGVDLLDEGETGAWRDALRGRFGRVDGLLHLVGGWRGGTPLHEAPLEDWDVLHGRLVRTVQHTTRAFHDDLADSPGGRFVLVSGRQAQHPSNANAAYAAAKAAAEAWTLALADGFAASAATANIVVVDAILTPAMRAENPDGDFAGFAPTDHIAEAIAFLCTEAGAESNGRRLALHG